MKIELFKSERRKKAIEIEKSYPVFVCFIINFIYHNCDFYVFFFFVFLLLDYDFIKNHTTAEYI